MELHEILIKSHELVDAATIEFKLSQNELCVKDLAELREFLNEQPQLEAGGACESSKSSNGENHEC